MDKIIQEKLENIILNGKTRETFIIPNAEAGALNILYKNAAAVESVDYGNENITAVATVDAKTKGILARFLEGGLPDECE